MKTKLLIPIFALLAGLASRAAGIDAATQKLLGIETAALAEKSLPPEVAVYGSVLSPAPLVELIRQIAAAHAAQVVSKESLERVEKLFAAGELVARKEVQATQAQQAQDQVVVQGFEDRLAMEWGPRFSKLATADRSKLVDDLLATRQALIRLAVSRGESPATAPLAASLHTFGRAQMPIRCTSISPAPAVDPAFQSPAFFGLIETPTAPLAAGLALTGVLELQGKPRPGIFVPQDAVVFYLGKAWVYQQEDSELFERVEIPVDAPVEGGWFVAADVLEPHPAVTKGAQALLSKETLAPAAAEE